MKYLGFFLLMSCADQIHVDIEFARFTNYEDCKLGAIDYYIDCIGSAKEIGQLYCQQGFFKNLDTCERLKSK